MSIGIRPRVRCPCLWWITDLTLKPLKYSTSSEKRIHWFIDVLWLTRWSGVQTIYTQWVSSISYSDTFYSEWLTDPATLHPAPPSSSPPAPPFYGLDGYFVFISSPSHAGPNSFYVTNDNFFHFDNTLLRVIYALILHRWLHSNIVFFDGFKAIEAIGGVYPNGINMDKDERLACSRCKYLLSSRICYHDLYNSEGLGGYWNPGLSVKFKALFSAIEFHRYQMTATIPDKRVGTRSKFFPPPTFNVDNQVFSLFVGKKNAILSNIDQGGWRIRDAAQVSQNLFGGIVVVTHSWRLELWPKSRGLWPSILAQIACNICSSSSSSLNFSRILLSLRRLKFRLL